MTDPAQTLILARCSRCYRLAARYIIGGQHSPGWWWFARVRHSAGNTGVFYACTCHPRPVLPDGDELAALVARAKKADTPRRTRQATLTIRVV